MPQRVEELARSVLRDPVRVSVGAPNAAAVDVDQKLVFVSNEGGKMVAMRQLIQVCRRSLVCARARHHFGDVWRCVSGLSSPSSCTCALAFVAPRVVHVCHSLCVAALMPLMLHLISPLLSLVVFVFSGGAEATRAGVCAVQGPCQGALLRARVRRHQRRRDSLGAKQKAARRRCQAVSVRLHLGPHRHRPHGKRCRLQRSQHGVLWRLSRSTAHLFTMHSRCSWAWFS